MNQPIDSRCVDCGATFPRQLGEKAGGVRLACPTCGNGVIRGLPKKQLSLGTPKNARCANCGATFHHAESKTRTKGVLACPVCESPGDVQRIDADTDLTT